MSLALRISVDFPDWRKFLKNANPRKLCVSKILQYNYGIFIFMVSHYRLYQTSYIYLFRCSCQTISYIMILIREDYACDARIARDCSPAYASYLPEGVSLA